MKKYIFLLTLLAFIFPKEPMKFKIPIEKPKDIKLVGKHNSQSRTEEILYFYDFEGGEEFDDANSDGQWNIGEDFIDANNNNSYDSSGDGWSAYGNWVTNDQFYNSDTHSYNSPHAFNQNSKFQSPTISLPELSNDPSAEEKLLFKFWILNNMFDADGNNNGFLDDFFQLWLLDLDAPTTWHKASSPSVSEEESAYWCADETIGTNGGYGENYLDFLDTPSVLVGENGVLFADLRWVIEDYTGASWNNSCTDGWDAINVRISSDGGETWSLLEDPNLPYNFECGMGFISNDQNYEEGYSLNHLAAGWGGTNPVVFGENQFSTFTADLSDYANQEVIVRFAFGSDWDVSGYDDSSLTGLEVDNILIIDDEGYAFEDYATPGPPDIDGGLMLGDAQAYTFLFYDWKGVDPYFGLPRPGSNGWEEYTPGSAFFGMDTSSDVTQWAGHDIKFEFISYYDGNSDGGQGNGLFFDDFTVFKETEEPLVGQTLTEEQLNTEFEVCYGNDQYEVGDTFKVGDYDGSTNENGFHYVTLINIDASWCPPCFDNLYDLANLSDEFSDNNAFMLAEGLFDYNEFGGDNVDSQTTCNEWGEEMANYTDSPPIVFDDSDYVAMDWWETDYSIPSFILLDHNMQIRYSGNNLTYWSTRGWINLLLDECGDLCNNEIIVEGDINLDNLVNILDIMILIDFILDDIYNQEADFNNDGVINIIDILFIVDIIIDSENL